VPPPQVRSARAHAGELVLVGLGPLTNIAAALQLEPELPKMVKTVVCMGGSFNHPGNITAKAEANGKLDNINGGVKRFP